MTTGLHEMIPAERLVLFWIRCALIINLLNYWISIFEFLRKGRDLAPDLEGEKVEDRNLEIEDQDLGEEDQGLERKGQDPETEDQDPGREDQDPETEDQGPETEDQGPEIEDQDPGTHYKKILLWVLGGGLELSQLFY